MDTLAPQIASLASTREVPLPADGAATLARYVEVLAELGRNLNLSAAKSAEDVVRVLVGPSLVVSRAWPDTEPPAVVVDIGSGNGFPGVVAAVLWPAAEVVLVERRGRKAAAITTCLARAGIEARVLACDARELPREAPELMGHSALVTARGVGKLDGVNRLASPLLAPGGVVAHWKAFALAPDERETAKANQRALGLEPSLDLAFEPGPPGPGRLVCFRKTA